MYRVNNITICKRWSQQGCGLPPRLHHVTGQTVVTLPFLYMSAVNWLNHGQTLREQGVEETETLILRRKYFYSDQNVDSRDPIQLNLLYVQVNEIIVMFRTGNAFWHGGDYDDFSLFFTFFLKSRDGILKGQYPVSEKDAITFAALQCQVQFGPHDEKKHKQGYLEYVMVTSTLANRYKNRVVVLVRFAQFAKCHRNLLLSWRAGVFIQYQNIHNSHKKMSSFKSWQAFGNCVWCTVT